MRSFIKSFINNKLHMRFFGRCLLYNVVAGFETSITTSCIFSAMSSNGSEGIIVNYLAKDIISNISSLYVIGKYSSDTDKNPYKSLIYSQLFNQISVVSEALSVKVSSEAVVPLLGFCSAGRCVSYITSGALTAKCIQKLSPDNIGEMYAKAAIINTMGNSVGTILGLIFITKFQDKNIQISILPFVSFLRFITLRRIYNGILF